jgi:hypothetical protein
MWVIGRALGEVVLKFTSLDDLAQAKRNQKMRVIASILAAFVASGPAAAQSWNEYAYPSYSVALSFPADPKIEITTYQAADGRLVEARVYSVTQDKAVFKMTIIDLSDAAMEESAVIDHAIKALSQEGEIKVNLPARINRVYGRQLSIVGADGSHSSAAGVLSQGSALSDRGESASQGEMRRRPTPSASSNRSSSPVESRTDRTSFESLGGIVEVRLTTPVLKALRPWAGGN